MFHVRTARIDDSDTLLKLAKMVHFINLPADRQIIADKIIRSRQCMRRAAAGDYASASGRERRGRAAREGGDGGANAMQAARTLPTTASGIAQQPTNLYMFVLEDTESPGPLGTSQVIAQMGGPGAPNVSLRLEERELYSQSLKFGSRQMVARMHLDESSPTEIGGLILQPSFRGHPKKLGRFLSLVRFHFIGLHRPGFADEILAEMMGPTTGDGKNLFWDYFGRRFIPLSYEEADKFCQYSREFMTSLLPRGDIYVSLLPPEARAVIAEVGPETVPARRMLEKLGFRYQQFIDPFDGGPNLRARTDDVDLVQRTAYLELGEPAAESRCREAAIVSRLSADGEFRSVNEKVLIEPGVVRLGREAMHVIEAKPGDRVGCTLLDPGATLPSARRRAAGVTLQAPEAKPPAKRSGKAGKQAGERAGKRSRSAAGKASKRASRQGPKSQES